MSYFDTLLQNVQMPAALQHAANIANGATWSSGYVSSLNCVGIQPNLSADQNCIVYVDQCSVASDPPDAGTDSLLVYANTPYGWTVQATSAYVQLRVKNTGLVPTTSLTLATALCPIVEAVPRALTQHGNFRVAVNEINSMEFGSDAWVTPMGALRVADSVRLAGTNMFDPASATLWTDTPTSGGTATTTGGHTVFATGTTSGGGILREAVGLARYVAGMSNYFRGQIRRPSCTGANTMTWGARNTANDGAWFSVDNVAGLAVVTSNGGTPASVPNGSFNGHLGASYVVDTSVHVYEIVYSTGSVWFMIDGELLHKVSATSGPWAATLHLRPFVRNQNGANINNNTLNVRSATVNRLGPHETQQRSQYISTLGTFTLKNACGILKNVVIGTQPTGGDFVVTLYDNTAASGTIIDVLTIRGQANARAPVSINYGVRPFFIGLTVVTSGTAGSVSIDLE